MKYLNLYKRLAFNSVDVSSLKAGDEIYYTVRKSEDVNGPFKVCEKDGELCLENAQRVKIPIRKFKHVSYWTPRHESA